MKKKQPNDHKLQRLHLGLRVTKALRRAHADTRTHTRARTQTQATRGRPGRLAKSSTGKWMRRVIGAQSQRHLEPHDSVVSFYPGLDLREHSSWWWLARGVDDTRVAYARLQEQECGHV